MSLSQLDQDNLNDLVSERASAASPQRSRVSEYVMFVVVVCLMALAVTGAIMALTALARAFTA